MASPEALGSIVAGRLMVCVAPSGHPVREFWIFSQTLTLAAPFRAAIVRVCEKIPVLDDRVFISIAVAGAGPWFLKFCRKRGLNPAALGCGWRQLGAFFGGCKPLFRPSMVLCRDRFGLPQTQPLGYVVRQRNPDDFHSRLH